MTSRGSDFQERSAASASTVIPRWIELDAWFRFGYSLPSSSLLESQLARVPRVLLASLGEKIKFIRRATRGMSPWVRYECFVCERSHATLKLDARWRHKRKKREDASPLCGWVLFLTVMLGAIISGSVNALAIKALTTSNRDILRLEEIQIAMMAQ